MRSLHRKALPIALILAPAGYLLMGGCGIFPDNSYSLTKSASPAPSNIIYKSDFIPNTTYRLQQPVIATAQFANNVLHSSLQLIPQTENPSHGQPLPPYARDPKYIAAALPAGANLKLTRIVIIHNDLGVLEAHPIMSINDPRFPTLHELDAYPISNVPAKLPTDDPNILGLCIDPNFLQPLSK